MITDPNVNDPTLVDDLTDANNDQYPDVDFYDLMELGFDTLSRVSIEALREKEMEVLPEEEDWN